MKKEIIKKSNQNKQLTYEELSYFFNGYIKEKINDKEMTIILKNICKNGLTEQEIFDLTDIFIKSGDQIKFDFPYLDKHSTGGVGDKTTLIIAPIIASCGVKIAKMSGRALGHTGGTIDKLESIKIKTNLTKEELEQQVNDINMAITSQTANICPMDKKIYALRDITNTTESIPLIAISIMSKKIASGADNILIDVKVGKGALIKTKKDAIELSKLMIKIGKKYNKKVICILTKMDNPLGDNIGNKIEILEVIDILQNKKQNNLYELCVYMSSILISIYKNITVTKAKKEVIENLKNNKAYEKFLEFVKYQQGDINIELPKPIEVLSTKTGYINQIDSMILGQTSMQLGAGRKQKEDKIDYNAGIIINKNIGDFVKEKEVLCRLYGIKKIDINNIYKAYQISPKRKNKKQIIIKVIK